MLTDHLNHTRTPESYERPAVLPRLTADDFCKAKYSHQDKRCYTGRILDVFLDERFPFVAAYKEFRLATMDYLYLHHKDDHAGNAEQRAACWNSVAEKLGYTLVSLETYNAYAETLFAGDAD